MSLKDLAKSAFMPTVLEERHSKYSGTLRVVKSLGATYITTEGLTQTGGLVHDVWDPILKKHHVERNKRWLILGLAAGTLAEIISQKYHPSAIVGVEVDPVMLELAKKYFRLYQIPELQVINQDAQKFVEGKQKFDYIFVDMYLGDKVPGFVYSSLFLEKVHRMLEPEGKVFINHLFYDDQKQAHAKMLTEKVQRIFPDTSLSRVLTNLIIVGTGNSHTGSKRV